MHDIHVLYCYSKQFLLSCTSEFGDVKKIPLLTSSKVSVWSSSVAWHRQNRHDCLEIFLFVFLKFEKKKKKGTEKFALYIRPAPGGSRFPSAELHLWQDVLPRAWEHSRITKPPHRFSFFFSFLSRKLKLNQGSNHLSRGQYAATFISAP